MFYISNMKLIFFGDSLIEMGRNRDTNINNYSSYGRGFVFEVAAELFYAKPGYYEVVNRGIGGEKVTDLFARYEQDVITEKPDVLTNLIGINDIWAKIWCNTGTDLDVYEETYLKMVNDIKKKLAKTKIILMEPFIEKGDAEKRELVHQYALAAQRVAKQSQSIFIPLQERLNEFFKDGNQTQILYDGMHTNPGGARVLALKWLETFKAIEGELK